MSTTVFTQTQAMALKIGNAAAQALFCTFRVDKEPDGDLKKIPLKRDGTLGVKAITPSDALFTADDVWGMEAIQHGKYFGLNMNKPLYVEGRGFLVCIDVDTKRKFEGDTTHQLIQNLGKWTRDEFALNEKSISGKGGRHIFVWAKKVAEVPKTYFVVPAVNGRLIDGADGSQNIEVFGLPDSKKVSVLLTGDGMWGEIPEVEDLGALFISWGVTEAMINPPPEKKNAAHAGNLEFLNHAPARQYANDPQVTYSKAVEALKFISDSDYDQWIKVGQALHDGFGEQGRALWMDWSSGGAKYQGEGDIDTHWKSFHQGGGVGIGTLFYLAAQHGYHHPEGFSRHSAYSDFSGVTIDNETGEILEPHFLARFINLDGQTKPPRWVIPGFIEHTVVVISGSAGVGKTTAILPLALTAAGLHGGELMPIHWRHVVYITEDVEQAKRILAGIVNHGDLGIEWADVRERLHMVPAKRLKPEVVASVGNTYREMFTRTVQGVEILPLVVLDTKSAVLDVADENSNSEASKMMAALKQGFNSLPIWLTGHVAKALKDATEGLTSRGAGAIEADANQTMFLKKDKDDKRYLENDKRRFEQKWPQIDLISNTKTIMAVDEFGNPEEVTLRWAIAMPGEIPNKELAEQRKAERSEQEEKLKLENTRSGLLNKAVEAWNLGTPYNRTGLKGAVTLSAAYAQKVMDTLFHERWLHEIDVPWGDRVNNSKKSYVIALTTPEHDALLAGEDVLPKYRVIPASWKKAPIPVAPENVEGIPESGLNLPENEVLA